MVEFFKAGSDFAGDHSWRYPRVWAGIFLHLHLAKAKELSRIKMQYFPVRISPHDIERRGKWQFLCKGSKLLPILR